MQSTIPARIPRLDGVRGLAAVGVMLHHIFLFLFPWQFAAVLFAVPAEWIHRFGWTLVDLFFVLSGYVFAHVYLPDERLRSDAGLAEFWVARIARLWPLHLTVLVLVAAFGVASSANTVSAFIAQVFMLQAFVQPVAGTFDWSSWSVSVEVFCYAVFCIASRRDRRTLLWVTGILIGVALLAVILKSQAGGPHAGGVFRRGLLGFFVGQALWHARGWLTRVPTAVLAGLACAGLMLEVGAYSPVLPLTVLAWPSVLLLAMRFPAMESRALTWLGDRSYAIYLINLPLIQVLAHRLGGARLASPTIVAIQAAVVAAVLLGAHASFHLIEAPSRRAIRRRFERRESADALTPWLNARALSALWPFRPAQ